MTDKDSIYCGEQRDKVFINESGLVAFCDCEHEDHQLLIICWKCRFGDVPVIAFGYRLTKSRNVFRRIGAAIRFILNKDLLYEENLFNYHTAKAVRDFIDSHLNHLSSPDQDSAKEEK